MRSAAEGDEGGAGDGASDAEHLPPAAQPIVLWETVINRLSHRCSAAYLRDKGKVEDAAGGDGEDAAASASTAAGAATAGKCFLSAAAYGDAKTAQRLLREGVDVNARDELQHTALHHAAAAGDLAMSRLLLDDAVKVGVFEMGRAIRAQPVDGAAQ